MANSEPKVVGDHLKSLLLCCCSSLSAAVDTLVKAYRFKLPVDVGGYPNPGYALFLECAKELGVPVQEIEVPSKDEYAPYTWLSDHSTPNLRAWIPDMKRREADYHVLFPFFMRYHLMELRKHEPDFPAPQLSNLYVILLWAKCFGSRQPSLSARVLRDLVAWEKAEHLTAHQYRGLIVDEVRTAHSKVMSLSDLSQLYLGFCSGAEGWKLVENKEIEHHPFNQRSRQYASAMVIASGGGGAKLPVLVNQYTWDIHFLPVITKNAWALNHFGKRGTPEDVAKARDCLLLRLQGLSEETIGKQLGFSDQKQFYQWQVERFIDIDPNRLREPYDAWLKACEFFDVQPTDDFVKLLTEPFVHRMESPAAITLPRGTLGTEDTPVVPRGTSESPETRVETDGGAREFKHGPDYRSVVSVDGEMMSLTERQAEVIRMLHEAFLNGTPEISQARIIEEVYGAVQENRLKKLFANNSAWDALIQPGKRRGLIRLRTDLSDGHKS